MRESESRCIITWADGMGIIDKRKSPIHCFRIRILCLFPVNRRNVLFNVGRWQQFRAGYDTPGVRRVRGSGRIASGQNG